MSKPEVYLIPSFVADDAINTIAPYVMDCVKKCQVLFVENERTTRRFLKAMDKSIVIDSFEWVLIPKNESDAEKAFLSKIAEEKVIGIVSEAGCPGIADPGQYLVYLAQQKSVKVIPLVGPSSIVLALMASGMNGQSFEFVGYLPIEKGERIKMIRELETKSALQKCTKIFIETPYRNRQLLDDLLNTCNTNTLVCIGINITSPEESIITKTVVEWRHKKPELAKVPVIYLLLA